MNSKCNLTSFAFSSGINLPVQLSSAAMVQCGDNFFLVGGYKGPIESPYFAAVYQYNAIDNGWIELDSKLKKGRAHHVALLVKKSLYPECA